MGMGESRKEHRPGPIHLGFGRKCTWTTWK
ncbi:hypothetical protein CCACVL1_11173, partial [Corchorus capsularis]